METSPPLDIAREQLLNPPVDLLKPSPQGSAIVVGASLAGLMTSLALARAGVRVTLLERAGPSPRSGAVLQVDSGELDRTVTAIALRVLASGGVRSAEAWSSVHDRLSVEASATPNLEVRYNTRVQSVQQNDEVAWVVTEQGESLPADLVVGADGHRSTVRRLVAPHKPDATFAGYLIWVAIVEERDIPAQHRYGQRAPAVSMPDGIGDFLLGAVTAGSTGSHAVGQRRLGWAWYDNTRNDLLRKLGCVTGNVVRHSLIGADIPEQTLQELTRQAAQRWPQPWLAATQYSIQTRNLTGIPISEYVPDRLVNGRIALVGDAGHVTTPITAAGFNAALQDAATLAECVEERRQGSDIVQALLDYESRRLPAAQQQVRGGQNFSRSFGR
ncbi:FAD-dependent monooxygenase [Hymenobacter lucidus]|uniref:FAD-dependent monooxygenase n=1 Tax=Hymenobacter lucidus TaxID=2880930 RepID=A0ABS8AZ60_9BACT|nr:NAD(P)/FAD-dependent oxidoreductase [Hymenobacter lucidus]MCB2411092.1 FAD-dependent monooxygenase [Hymenobacter lucidus]